MENRFFFPQAALDHWVVDEKVEFSDGELAIIGAGKRYMMSEAVHVVREVSGTTDRHDLVGRVKLLGALQRLGAEIVESSMLLDDVAYDVEPGWIGTPIIASPTSSTSSRPDDEILALLARSTQA
jgi:hypothetical protein